MGADFDYIHSIPGRLRVKVPEVRRSPEAARRVEQGLRALATVCEVRANPHTGNVLVRYEEGGMGPERIIEAIRALGYLRVRRPSPAPAGATLLDALSAVASNLLLDAIFGPVAGGLVGVLLVGGDSAGARVVPAGGGHRAEEAPRLGVRRAVA